MVPGDEGDFRIALGESALDASRGRQRGATELWLVFFIAALAVAIAALVASSWKAGQACEAKGGTYYCGHKSSCLCLAPGVVLP